MISPCSGRLFARHLADGAAIVAGVLHLPPEISIVEGAAYALRFDGDQLRLSPVPVADPLPVQPFGWAISDWLHGRAWFRSSDPEVLTVRFVAAFPASNGWAVCGVAANGLAATQRDAAGHSWWTVGEGTLTALAPPCDARGMAISQILTQVAAWPDAAGALHTLSQVLSDYRPVLLQYHQLLARAGRGAIALSQARDTIRETPALWQVGAGTLDPDFCRYLAHLEDVGALRLDEPLSAPAAAAREQLAGWLVAELA